MNAKSSKLLLLSALLTVVSCGRLSTESEDAQDAVDTSDSTSNEGALMDLTAVDSSTAMCGATSEQIAGLTIARFKNNVNDAACVAATQTGATVSYVMTNCTGKFGKLHVTGTIDVTYTRNADCSVDAVAHGTGITVNKSTIDLDATGHYSKNANGLETVAVTTHSKGGNGSVQLDHSGSYTVTRDSSSCRTLDGTWSTEWSAARGDATTSTVASGLKKCADACPVAGGSVVHHGLARDVTVTFDGSAVAQWTSSRGKSGTINLSCGE